MSVDTFRNRWPENVPGKFYVDQQCLDCNLCADIAPAHFARNRDTGYFYVSRQPVTIEERSLLNEAVEGCPCEAIKTDGDDHDWSLAPEGTSLSESAREKRIENKTCCRGPVKRWWQFWR